MQLSSHDATMSEAAEQFSEDDLTSRFLFLGTSTSVGVPVIGCNCPTCLSDDPRDNRTRSSALLEGPWGSLLIDSGPDLREQSLRENLSKVDAVLYTHEHVDHVVGFDELRAFCWRRESPLPLYGSPETLGGLARMFPWAFAGESSQRGYVRPEARSFDGPFEFGGLKITPVEVDHGRIRTHGFRFDHSSFGSLAYLPDVKTIPPESMELLRGLGLLVIDGLRQESHSTHLSIPEALEIIEDVAPGKSILTHLSHEIKWEETNANLPANVSLAYDGLSLKFPSS